MISQNLGIYFLRFGGVKFCPQEGERRSFARPERDGARQDWKIFLLKNTFGLGRNAGNSKLNTSCLRSSYHFASISKGVPSSASASGISARATSALLSRCGRKDANGSNTSKWAVCKKPACFGLERGRNPLSSYGLLLVPSESALRTTSLLIFNFTFCVSLLLCSYELQENDGARPLVMDAQRKCPRRNTNALDPPHSSLNGHPPAP